MPGVTDGQRWVWWCRRSTRKRIQFGILTAAMRSKTTHVQKVLQNHTHYTHTHTPIAVRKVPGIDATLRSRRMSLLEDRQKVHRSLWPASTQLPTRLLHGRQIPQKRTQSKSSPTSDKPPLADGVGKVWGKPYPRSRKQAPEVERMKRDLRGGLRGRKQTAVAPQPPILSPSASHQRLRHSHPCSELCRDKKKEESKLRADPPPHSKRELQPTIKVSVFLSRLSG